MSRVSRHSLIILTALFSGATLAAGQGPVVIDSEQKANMAVHSITVASSVLPNEYAFNVNYAREVAQVGMQVLDAATTPTAVLNARNGVTVNCANSGNIVARMARSTPHVLKLQWNACNLTDINLTVHQYTGTSEVVLRDDSFAPDKVAALRFGAPTQDFTDVRTNVYPNYTITDTRTLNLRLTGCVPIGRFSVYSIFVGDFGFEVTGFVKTQTSVVYPDPGSSYQYGQLTTFDGAVYSGSNAYLDSSTRLVSELNGIWGTVTFTSINGPPYGDITSSYDLRGLRYREEYDFVASTHKWWLDGAINYRFAPPLGWSTSCIDGQYTFRTKTPMTIDLANQGVFAAGSILVNGSTLASFYSPTNVPAGLPVPQNGMLVNLDVRNLGSFTYDVSDLLPLQMKAQCQLF